MTNKLISDLPVGPTNLAGTELIEIQVGLTVGASQQTTISKILSAAQTYLAGIFATAAQGAEADTAVQTIVAGTNVSINSASPKNPIVNVPNRVVSVNAGTGVNVNNTDPLNPIVSAQIGILAGLNDQTGTSYTLQATDMGKDIRCTNAAAIAFDVNTQALVPVAANFWCLVSQGGAGVVTITALAGVTLRAPNGAVTSAIYDARGLERISGDEWRVW